MTPDQMAATIGSVAFACKDMNQSQRDAEMFLKGMMSAGELAGVGVESRAVIRFAAQGLWEHIVCACLP
jgi:hypothetical protein